MFNLVVMIYPQIRFLTAMSMIALFGCSSNSAPLSIDFTADSAGIEIRNIDKPGLLELSKLPAGDSALSDLVSVVVTPSDRYPGIMEAEVPGCLTVGDSSIVFHPDKPFVRGQDYLVITHINSAFGDVGQAMKNELSTSVKPSQKLLSR
jgi:hypothetical protein